jgi:hypothetical protein
MGQLTHSAALRPAYIRCRGKAGRGAAQTLRRPFDPEIPMPKALSDLTGEIDVRAAAQDDALDERMSDSEPMEVMLERVIYPYGKPTAQWARRPVDPFAFVGLRSVDPARTI